MALLTTLLVENDTILETNKDAFGQLASILESSIERLNEQSCQMLLNRLIQICCDDIRATK